MRAMAAEEEDFAAAVAALPDGWVKAMGLVFVRATASEVVVELEVGPQHLQPMGIVHGGVYAGIVETVTSIAAGIDANQRGGMVVGLENHTSFLHATRSGKLVAVARPLTRGSRTQVWEATITNAEGKTAATGRVRFLVIPKGSALAGGAADIQFQ